MNNSKRIGLVIGWGSVKCAAALGLAKVLQREGIQLDLIVATGAGSIFGSLLALGRSAEEVGNLAKRLWTHEITGKTNYKAVFQILFPKWFVNREFVNFRRDNLINARLREAFGETTFAETRTRLFITATNYRTGAQEVISQGLIYDAVRATISLPMIFPPVERDGKLLSEGFLSDPIPVGVAVKEGAQIILVMGFESISSAARYSIADYATHLSGILSNNLLNASLAFYQLAHHSEVLPIIVQFDDELGLFDVHRIPEIVRIGETEAEKALPAIKKLLSQENPV